MDETARQILNTVDTETMARMLAAISIAVGISAPGSKSRSDLIFFERQVVERVKEYSKSAELYHGLVRPLKIAVNGRL